MPRGRPKRDKQAERLAAEELIGSWRRNQRIGLSLTRNPDWEKYWLRLRLGESEDTVDVLDSILEPGTPPLSDTVS